MNISEIQCVQLLWLAFQHQSIVLHFRTTNLETAKPLQKYDKCTNKFYTINMQYTKDNNKIRNLKLAKLS